MGHLTAEDLIRIPTKDCLQMLFLLSDTLFRSMARHMLLLIMKIFLFLKKSFGLYVDERSGLSYWLWC